MSLIRLVHAGRPKTFTFTSSVATCMGIGHTSPYVPETPIGDDLSVSLNTGYALSKYIGTSSLLIPIPMLTQNSRESNPTSPHHPRNGHQAPSRRSTLRLNPDRKLEHVGNVAHNVRHFHPPRDQRLPSLRREDGRLGSR